MGKVVTSTPCLRIPLGSYFKPTMVWDVIEERLEKRLALLEHQALSKSKTYFTEKYLVLLANLLHVSSCDSKAGSIECEKIQRNFLWEGDSLDKKAASGLQGKRGVKAFYYLNKAFLESSAGVCKKREIHFFVSEGKMLGLVCDELLREDGRC